MQRGGMYGSEALLGNGPRANNREYRGARARPIKGMNIEGFKKKKLTRNRARKFAKWEVRWGTWKERKIGSEHSYQSHKRKKATHDTDTSKRSRG